MFSNSSAVENDWLCVILSKRVDKDVYLEFL